MEKTTIQISQETLKRLKDFKKFERQSYDDLLNGIFDELDEEVLNADEIEEIKIGLENIRRGKVKSIEQVAKELGVILK